VRRINYLLQRTFETRRKELQFKILFPVSFLRCLAQIKNYSNTFANKKSQFKCQIKILKKEKDIASASKEEELSPPPAESCVI
jgi:hypothetical protein